MISPLAYDNHSDFLAKVIYDRASTRGTSLRSFAKFAGLSPSFLSRIVSGERKLSVTAAIKLVRVLDLAPEEEAHLFHLIALQHLNPESKEATASQCRVLKASQSHRKVVDDLSFQIIAGWQHFAILALSRTKGFKARSTWISERLGISVSDASDSLERMVRAGLVRRISGGFVFVSDAEVETKVDFHSKAVQENHRQNLANAEKALKGQSVDKREFLNCTFAMDSKNIPKAKRRLRLFLTKFMRDFEQEDARDLFQFNMQLFTLTKENK